MDREIFDKYLSQQVLSASPAELVAMLHDRAILLLHDVVVAIEAGDVKRRWKSNSKATAIIAELWQSLDMERGAEIAENLSSFFGTHGFRHELEEALLRWGHIRKIFEG